MAKVFFKVRNEELFLFEPLSFEPLNFEPLNLNSSEGTTDNRQAVKRVARNPCKNVYKKIKVPKERQNYVILLCRTFGTLINI